MVPGFEELGGELFREAVTLGVESAEIIAYLNSIFEFVGAEKHLESLKPGGDYRCPETEILENFGVEVSQDTGLQLVREACDKLEEQIYSLKKREKTTSTKAGADEN